LHARLKIQTEHRDGRPRDGHWGGAMPTEVTTPSRRAFADRTSANNSSKTPTGEAREILWTGGRPMSTGKGSLSKSQSNSLFKQKAALSARTSPKTPVLRASKRATGARAQAQPAEPDLSAKHAMLTPGAIRQQRQSANGSLLGTSQHGSADRELSICHANTSSILSENSTVSFGSVDAQLSQSFSLGMSLEEGGMRFSLGSARDSIGSVRFSAGPGLVSFAAEAPQPAEAGGPSGQDLAMLQKKIAELQDENMALRSQFCSSQSAELEQPQHKRLSFCSQASSSPMASPQPSTPTRPTNVGYGEEYLQQLESNCASLKEQDERLNEVHSQLLTSLLGKDLADSASLGDAILAIKTGESGEYLRKCDVGLVKTHIRMLEAELAKERAAREEERAGKEGGVDADELADLNRRLRKAEEAEQELTKQLHAAQRSISQLSKDLEEVTKELDESKEQLVQVSELQAALDTLKAEHDDATRQLRKEQEAQHQAQAQLQAAQESISLLTKHLEAVREDADAADDEKEQVLEQRREEAERLQEKVAALEAEVEAFQRQHVQELEMQVEHVKQKASETQRELEMQLQGAQESISSLTKEVEGAREDITVLEEEVEDMKRQQVKASETQRVLEMQLQGAQESISSLTKELDAARRALEEKSELIAGVEQEVEDMKRQQSKANETILELEMKMQEAEESISSLTKEVEEARRAVGSAEEEKKRRGDEVERLREQMSGLEQEVQDGRRQRFKASETQRELEMQLQGAQKSISELTKLVDELRRAQEDAEVVVDELHQKLEQAEARHPKQNLNSIFYLGLMR
jgi:chromosome segregation ATPase